MATIADVILRVRIDKSKIKDDAESGLKSVDTKSAGRQAGSDFGNEFSKTAKETTGKSGNDSGQSFAKKFSDGFSIKKALIGTAITAALAAGPAAIATAGVAMGLGFAAAAGTAIYKSLTAQLKAAGKDLTAAQKSKDKEAIASAKQQIAALQAQLAAYDGVKHSVQDLRDTLIQVGNKALVTSGILGTAARVITGLGTWVTAHQGIFINLFKAAAPYVQVFVTFLERLVATALPIFTRLMQQAAPAVNAVLNGVVSFTKSSIGPFLATIGKNAALFAKAFNAILSELIPLLPLIGGLAVIVAKLVVAFPQLVPFVLGLALALKGMLIAQSVAEALITLTGAEGIAEAASIGLAAAMDAIPIVALGVALVAATILIIKYWKPISGFFVGVWKVIYSGFVGPLINFFTKTVPHAFGITINWLKQNWPLLIGIVLGPIAEIAGVVLKYHAQIFSTVVRIWTAVKNFIVGTWNSIFASGARIWNLIYSNTIGKVVALFNTVRTFISTSFDKWWSTHGAALEQVWRNTWNGITLIFRVAWSVLSAFAVKQFQIFATVFRVALTVLETIWRSVWSVISSIFKIAWAVIVGVAKVEFTIFSAIFRVGLVLVENLFRVAWGVVAAVTRTAWAVMGQILRVAWAAIELIFHVALNVLINAAKVTWAIIGAAVRSAWAVITAILKIAWDLIVAVFSVILDLMTGHWKQAWQDIRTFGTQVWNAIKVAFTVIWDSIAHVFESILSAIKSIFVNAWNNIKSFTDVTLHAMAASIGAIWNGIKQVTSSIWNGIKGIVFGVWNALKSATAATFNDISQTISRIWGGIVNVVKQPIKLVIAAYNVFADGVNFVANKVFGQHIDARIHTPKGFAGGGKINGGTTETADDMLVRVSKNETIVSAGHSRALAPAFRSVGVPGYAKGGVPKTTVDLSAYTNPLPNPKRLTPTRIDQGVDFQGAGPMAALGDAEILNTTGGGWPGGPYMSFRLIDGILSGLSVYYAENIHPLVRPGQHVKKGAHIADWFDGGTGIEMGFDDGTGGRPLSQTKAAGSISGANLPGGGTRPTQVGKLFDELLVATGLPFAPNYNLTPGGSLPGSLSKLGNTGGNIGTELEALAKSVGHFAGSLITDLAGIVGNTLIPAPLRHALSVLVGGVGGATKALGHPTGEFLPIVGAALGKVGGWAADWANNKVLDKVASLFGIDLGSSSPGGGTGPAGGATGGNVANGQELYSYLLKNLFGGNKIAAAGATASIWGESLWNPFATGTGGRGLIGWTPPSTISNADFSGGMRTQLPAILKFVTSSGDSNVIAEMFQATSVAQAAGEWGRGVERFGKSDIHSEGISLATQFMNKNAWGGSINQPVYGIGANGQGYSFAENGPERIIAGGKDPMLTELRKLREAVEAVPAKTAAGTARAIKAPKGQEASAARFGAQ